MVTRSPTPAEYRQAAETERLNPYESHDEREARAAHHLAEAERLEKINEQ